MAFTTTTWQNSGTITASSQTVTLDCPGSASAVIAVTGTFVGTLTITGSGDSVSAGGNQGGRLVFKSGVGSLGMNKIIGIGTAIANEYRIVTGGRSVTVTSTNWTSGSATIEITASPQPSAVFVNGPVHTALEEAIRAGRAFSASTSLQSVAIGNYLNIIFSNPSNSNVNVFIMERSYSNSSGNILQFTSAPNPTALTSPTSVTPTNLNTGGITSACTFVYKAQTTALTTSSSTVSGTIPNTGMPYTTTTMRCVTPGQSTGAYIGGVGGVLTAAATVGINYTWYEEPVN